jgi:hypothetical protein
VANCAGRDGGNALSVRTLYRPWSRIVVGGKQDLALSGRTEPHGRLDVEEEANVLRCGGNVGGHEASERKAVCFGCSGLLAAVPPSSRV